VVSLKLRRFTRLTNGLSKRIEAHTNAVALHLMYYNFVRFNATFRMTQQLPLPLPKGFGRSATPWR
jgi:hypothetical protein